MKALLKKSAILKTISSKISTYLHAIDADPQEDDSDFDDEEWMECPTKPTLAHIVLDLLLSPTYRLPKTVTAVRIYRDENIALHPGESLHHQAFDLDAVFLSLNPLLYSILTFLSLMLHLFPYG